MSVSILGVYKLVCKAFWIVLIFALFSYDIGGILNLGLQLRPRCSLESLSYCIEFITATLSITFDGEVDKYDFIKIYKN